ncbi:ribonuclease H-like domain-containing protein [Phellopilus nigrolimitatus]|nr:ribonuclease H-like domain-containing protein [Phellopilus nigrolimitatus]
MSEVSCNFNVGCMKLGGVNHQLDTSSMRWLKNTMFIGMGTPSIAAVVANRDEDFMHYLASVGFQEHGEMITDVMTMMTERLNEYSKRIESLPERVIMFRGGGKTPKLTIAICGKCPQTRFYPAKPEQGDKTSNTKAGTFVDQAVTAVYNFDFFLQAHTGR